MSFFLPPQCRALPKWLSESGWTKSWHRPALPSASALDIVSIEEGRAEEEPKGSTSVTGSICDEATTFVKDAKPLAASLRNGEGVHAVEAMFHSKVESTHEPITLDKHEGGAATEQEEREVATALQMSDLQEVEAAMLKTALESSVDEAFDAALSPRDFARLLQDPKAGDFLCEAFDNGTLRGASEADVASSVSSLGLVASSLPSSSIGAQIHPAAASLQSLLPLGIKKRELPSVGTVGHGAVRNCKLCKAHLRNKSCERGSVCYLCHGPHSDGDMPRGRGRARQRGFKRDMRRTRTPSSDLVGPAPGGH